MQKRARPIILRRTLIKYFQEFAETSIEFSSIHIKLLQFFCSHQGDNDV